MMFPLFIDFKYGRLLKDGQQGIKPPIVRSIVFGPANLRKDQKRQELDFGS